MLLLEAMKLSADPKFSEFKPLMALACHAINLGRAAWFWSSLKRNMLHQSVFQVSFSNVVDLLKTFCMFYNAFYSLHFVLTNVEHYF